jgi:hypothetical protein
MLATRPRRGGGLKGGLGAALALLFCVVQSGLAQAEALPDATPSPSSSRSTKKRPRPPALRFAGRLQILSGAAFAVPQDHTGARRFAAYVPVDVEVAMRLAGPLSLGLGGVGYLAPFSITTCGETVSSAARPNALGAFLGMRLDFNNSRDGSWWSPWVALRGGIMGQNGVGSGDPCTERFQLGMYLSPRVGADLWLGQAAVSFAVGYDHLPRAPAISAQVGLTLRLF